MGRLVWFIRYGPQANLFVVRDVGLPRSTTDQSLPPEFDVAETNQTTQNFHAL